MTVKTAQSKLLEAYRMSFDEFDGSLLSSTSTRRFDRIRKALSDITGLENSKDDIYIVSAGTRVSNLQVRSKQGDRAGRHTQLGVGFIDNEGIKHDEAIENLFDSLRANVVKKETSYDAFLIIAADGDTCEVAAVFGFSGGGLVRTLKDAFPSAQFLAEEVADAREVDPASLTDYVADPGVSEKAFELLNHYKNLILEGPPGSGKTEFAKHLAYQHVNDPAKVISLQFHPAYSYEEFVIGWRPKETEVGWERQLGVFPQFCRRAIEDPESNFVLIIDELNRAEIVAVFGEAFTLIDASKRSPMWSIPLQGSGSEEHLLHVPENVFIVATINSADRTAHALDHALRRRFAFLSIPPNFGPEIQALMHRRGLDEHIIDDAIDRIERINAIIKKNQFTLGEGFQIAHGYLIPNSTVENSVAWWLQTRDHRILPVLRDYFFDDPEALENVTEILLEGRQ